MSGSHPVQQVPRPQTQSDGAPAKRTRRPRSPSIARPAFIVVQLMDDHGQPMQFDKKRVKIIAVERSAEKVLEAVESGEHPNAFYLRVVVPAGTRAGTTQQRAPQHTAA